MESNRGLKIISIIGLCLGIFSLAIGFANYSSMLKITPLADIGTSGGTFKVEFSTSPTTSSIENMVITNESGLELKTPVISNSGNDPAITNLGATFTQPGQSVTYTFYARNVGQYTAFLNSVTLTGSKSCSAVNGTSEEVKNTLCNGLSLTITVGEEGQTVTLPTPTAYDTDINGHNLPIESSEKIVVTISYNPAISLVGDITATFGTIGLNYNGID